MNTQVLEQKIRQFATTANERFARECPEHKEFLEIQNALFDKNTEDPKAEHDRIRQIWHQWARLFVREWYAYFDSTFGQLGTMVAEELEEVAREAVPDITEDLEKMKLKSLAQVEYLLKKFNQMTPAHQYEVLFTMEHLARVVSRLSQDPDLDDKKLAGLELWSEHYARFVCFVGDDHDYQVEPRRLWLKILGKTMLELARKFNKPLYWLYYGRSQHLLSRLLPYSDRLKVLENCLDTMQSAKEIPDVRILRGTLLHSKAMITHSIDPASSARCWEEAQVCFQTVGTLLNGNLLYKHHLFAWASGTQSNELRDKSYALARTVVNDVNIGDVLLRAYFDDWWNEIADTLHSLFNVSAFKMPKEDLYGFMAQYPNWVAALIHPFQESTRATHVIQPEPLKRKLQSESTEPNKRLRQ